MLETMKDGIYRIIFPFEEIYTTAFVLTNGHEAAVVDSGNSAEDAENEVIPVLQQLAVPIQYIVTTHAHQDHSGGRERLMQEYPCAVCVDFFDGSAWKDGDLLWGRFQLLHLKGHSADGLVLYDIQTKTLLSGDALQQHGISKYRNGITNHAEYLRDIERVRAMDVDTIIASHHYDPCGCLAEGQKAVKRCLDECLVYWSMTR